MVGFAHISSPRQFLAGGMLFGTALLSGCGSTPQPVTQTSPTERVQPEQVEQAAAVKTAEEWLSDAQSLGPNEQNLVLRNRYLLEAANAYSLNQQCYQALVVINAVKATLANRQNQQLNDLLLAECAPVEALPYEQRIALLEQPFSDADLEQRRINLQTQLYVDTRQWLDAANQEEIETRRGEFLVALEHFQGEDARADLRLGLRLIEEELVARADLWRARP